MESTYRHFSAFRAANPLNLPNLQAEISRLEEQLRKMIGSDENQQVHSIWKKYQYNWSVLQDGENGDSKQMQLILELRTALSEYGMIFLSAQLLARISLWALILLHWTLPLSSKS